MAENNLLVNEALRYLSRGFSIIPVGQDKIPLVQWAEFQKRLPTVEEVNSWWTTWPQANVGIVTGKISGIVVVDIEKGGSVEGLPPTLISKTGGGGWHYYFKHPGFEINNSVKQIRDLVDIRGDGGYVVAPPSLHLSGKHYEWAVCSDDTDIEEIPEWILKICKEGKKEKVDWKKFSQKQNPIGDRNNLATKYIGKLLHELSPELWKSSAWPALVDWNQKNNTPALSESELRATFESIATAETNSRLQAEKEVSDEPKQSEMIIKSAKGKLNLFKDQLGEAYGVINYKEHNEIWPINTRNKRFRLWLVKIGREVLKKVPSEAAIKETIASLESDAVFDGETINLYNRVAPGENGSIWIDMSDSGWRAIQIDKTGWKIVDDPPILFRRYQHQLPMEEPDREGDIKLIDEFLNLVDPEYIILFYAFLVASLVPDIAVVCLILHGVQGSSKTTVFKILRSLIDPSVLEVLDFQENKKEIIQMLDHHRVCFFDNLSYIQRGTSDLLSKVITGSGFSRRELYSDDGDVMRQIKRVIGLNGINMAASQADLLERSIVVEMKSIDPEQRKSEKEMKTNFNSQKAKILGGILNLLSKTLDKLPEVEHTHLPRMTEFALYGEALSLVLGNKPDHFKSIYWKNINETTEKGIQSSIVASAILIFLSKIPEWSGTATELYEILSNVAVMNKIIPSYSYKWWPQEPNKLSEQINLVKPMLKMKDIEVDYDRSSSKRTIKLVNNNFSGKAENLVMISSSSPAQLSFVNVQSPSEVNDYSTDDDNDAPPQDADLESEDPLEQVDF